MKSITTFFCLALCLGLLAPAAYGQRSIVQESEKAMSLGSRPCFHLDFTMADADMVEKIWKDFVKSDMDAKMKKDKKTDEWSALGLENAFVGPGKFDLYAKIEANGKENAGIDIWFSTGASFLNRRDSPEHTDGTVTLLKQFYFKVRREVIAKELKNQTDRLEDAEKKMKNLKKDKESLQKDVEEYKAKIKKAEEAIVTNDKAQSSTQLEVASEKRNVEEIQRKLNNVESEGN